MIAQYKNMCPSSNPACEVDGHRMYGVSSSSSSSSSPSHYSGVDSMRCELRACSLSGNVISVDDTAASSPTVLKETPAKKSLERRLTESTAPLSDDVESDRAISSNHTRSDVGAESTSSGQEKQPKCVSFDKVQIRFYPIIMGDNPSCCCLGPPLQIDFKHFKQVDCPLDKYESQRKPR